MKLMKFQLIKLARTAISNFEFEETFFLREFQDYMKPMIQNFYDVESHPLRFRNHCYRAIGLLQQRDLVCRVSFRHCHNAMYAATDEEMCPDSDDRTEITSKESISMSEESKYEKELSSSIRDLEKLAKAHRELLDKFPAHEKLLAVELEKIIEQIEDLECQKKVLSKILA